MSRIFKNTVSLVLVLIFSLSCAVSAQTITDQLGRTVELDGPADSIVSCYYISTATLIALGAEEQLSGIEMKADTRRLYQLAAPEIINLPAVGSGKGINVEEIAAIHPDVVILPVKLKVEIESLETLGIPVIVIDPETQEGFYNCVQLLGEISGMQSNADELLNYYNEKFDEVAALVADIAHPDVYMSSGADYLRTYPGGMYQSALIEAAGGKNVAASLEGASQADISAEQLAIWNPEYMFVVADADYSIDDILNGTQLSAIGAIANKQVYSFPSQIEAWDYPTPSSVLGLLYMTHILHPELYAADQYRTEAEGFYQRFFDIEVTADDIGL